MTLPDGVDSNVMEGIVSKAFQGKKKLFEFQGLTSKYDCICEYSRMRLRSEHDHAVFSYDGKVR